MQVKTIYCFSLLLFFFFSAKAQTLENPPEDISFVVGSTSGAPNAGTDKLILVGTADWNVRLYRGKLKQSTFNDGSGIWYTKAAGSDTLFLHGDTWHTGELVQLEFYKPNGTLELGSQYVIQTASYVKVAPWGPDGPTTTGSWTSDQGGYPYFTTKKFMGNGYVQFQLNYSEGGSTYQFLQDESDHMWIVEYHPSINNYEGGIAISYNDTLITTIPNSGNYTSIHLRLKRNGVKISVEKSATANGIYTQVFEFQQECSPTQGLFGAGFSTGPNGATNCKIAGQSLVSVYN